MHPESLLLVPMLTNTISGLLENLFKELYLWLTNSPIGAMNSPTKTSPAIPTVKRIECGTLGAIKNESGGATAVIENYLFKSG